MSDRDLLEYAAKAAGYKRTRTAPNGMIQVHGWNEGYENDWEYWNPLTDDGDEARLEASLSLDVSWCGAGVFVGADVSTENNPACFEYFDTHNGDKQAARRLAGVRAAAEIGKAMP